MKIIFDFFRRLTTVVLQTGFKQNPWDKYKDYLKINKTAIIDPSSTLTIFNLPQKKKNFLEIGEYSHIFSNFSLVRSEAKIKIGKRCQIGSVHFNCAELIEVGDDVLMAWGITIIDNDSHSLYWKYRDKDVERCYKDYKNNKSNFIKNKDWSHVAIKPVIIYDKVWIGFNVSILKGVHIGNNSVIGAGSVVVNDVPSHALVAGNPAKIIRKI
ncbi:MAG: acyltransferase [Bacteroidota bacterium]